MSDTWDADSVGGLLRSLGLDGVDTVSDELIADFEQRALASEALESVLAPGVSPCNIFDASWE